MAFRFNLLTYITLAHSENPFYILVVTAAPAALDKMVSVTVYEWEYRMVLRVRSLEKSGMSAIVNPKERTVTGLVEARCERLDKAKSEKPLTGVGQLMDAS